jgi:monofunctional biosynthetic peptidoglycan transglycosylase
MAFIRRLVKLIGICLIAVLGAVLVSVPVLSVVQPPTSALMVLRALQGQTITRQWVPLSALSGNLVRSVVVAEDARFCAHTGVDWRQVSDVVTRLSENERPRGASTITMQLVKNLFLWPHRSYLRKLLELPLALYVDAVLSKRRILELYLNLVEFGPGLFGAQAASRHYFGRPAARLGPPPSAPLVAALPNPHGRNPQQPGRRHLRLSRIIKTRAALAGGLLTCLK